MFCIDASSPILFLFSNIAPQLLYYSHFPAIIVSLFLGLFVFLKNRESLLARVLLFLTIIFSLWSIFDIIAWVNIDSRIVMFFWAMMNLLEPLIYASMLYFAYVYIKKKDISISIKTIILVLLLPILILLPTVINLEYFDLANCESIQGQMIKYVYFVDILFSLWTLSFLTISIWKAEKESRKQIFYLSLGIFLFLSSFSWGNIFGNITTDWEFTQYGLFGMPIFMAFLAYLIIKFKAFNIKMFWAQALVAALVILIGSQFFFIRNFTNQILTGITLVLVSSFGWLLISSVKKEMERKEELQIMADSLANANDQLRKLDNSKSEFISIASHQLRTPLTAIKGFVSLIQEGSYGKVEPKIKETLNKIFISNERLIELVEDLLNISRIESGRMDYRIEKFKLEELINELYDTFSVRAKKKGLKLEMIFPENSLPEIETDRNKMREIISNLIDNAIKYTAKGWVRIKVSYADGIFRVAVIDTGMGTLKEDIPFLFSKFSRGTGASRVNAGGTGLGLHVGKRMIEALGGKIWVESEGAEKGSTFFVEAPIKYAERK